MATPSESAIFSIDKKTIKKIGIVVSTFMIFLATIFIWHSWPSYHLKLYKNALQDKNNLQENFDGKFDNPYKKDFAIYGAFGDTYGSLTSLFSCFAFIAAAAALLIQIYLSFDQKTHQIDIERKNKSFTLYDEFNSPEMFQLRIEADLFLRTNYNDFYTISETYIYDAKDRIKGAGSIWPIIRFYQKLLKSINYNQVNEIMVIDLFGEVFIGWYFSHFENKLVNIKNGREWDTAIDLKSLQIWFQDKCVQYKLQDKYSRWEKIARDNLEVNEKRYNQIRAEEQVIIDSVQAYSKLFTILVQPIAFQKIPKKKSDSVIFGDIFSWIRNLSGS